MRLCYGEILFLGHVANIAAGLHSALADGERVRGIRDLLRPGHVGPDPQPPEV